jgi:hypothetical protein
MKKFISAKKYSIKECLLSRKKRISNENPLQKLKKLDKHLYFIILTYRGIFQQFAGRVIIFGATERIS